MKGRNNDFMSERLNFKFFIRGHEVESVLSSILTLLNVSSSAYIPHPT